MILLVEKEKKHNHDQIVYAKSRSHEIALVFLL